MSAAKPDATMEPVVRRAVRAMRAEKDKLLAKLQAGGASKHDSIGAVLNALCIVHMEVIVAAIKDPQQRAAQLIELSEAWAEAAAHVIAGSPDAFLTPEVLERAFGKRKHDA